MSEPIQRKSGTTGISRRAASVPVAVMVPAIVVCPGAITVIAGRCVASSPAPTAPFSPPAARK